MKVFDVTLVYKWDDSKDNVAEPFNWEKFIKEVIQNGLSVGYGQAIRIRVKEKDNYQFRITDETETTK